MALVEIYRFRRILVARYGDGRLMDDYKAIAVPFHARAAVERDEGDATLFHARIGIAHVEGLFGHRLIEGDFGEPDNIPRLGLRELLGLFDLVAFGFKNVHY